MRFMIHLARLKDHYLNAGDKALAEEKSLLARVAEIDGIVFDVGDVPLSSESRSQFAISVRHALIARHQDWDNERICRRMMDITDKVWPLCSTS